ncbi:MAG: tRNA (N6-threonylcarbamoyladenosine(37)-N6)-methyltransferase TrmO [Ignavibacteriaceae bacterium]
MKIEYEPIGFVRSPYKNLKEIPNQPHYAKDITGQVEIFPEYELGLKDLDGFSHLILVCHFHMSSEFRLQVVPSRETEIRGLFSTRSPNRPNPVGISIVRLKKIEKNILLISDLDILDGTPVIDLKPYVGEFEKLSDVSIGWNHVMKKQ